MSTLLSASVPTEEFVLAETFERVPAVEFDALRLVGDGAEGDIPLLRARGAETSRVRDALESDSTTAGVELVSRRDRGSLFRVRWTARSRVLTAMLVGEGGAVLSARGTSDEWTFRLLFPEREAVSSTYDACAEYDVSIDRIRSLDERASPGGVRLTDTQFATLETALESGYYRVPREQTIEELATELDVSHQALSERLRRGHRTLVETVLEL
ncbi:DNA-binding protein [Halobacteriales archaeon QS_5_68_33]|nr:MAG: DNA-binding protein [Halobacteriales archaeon QS_5_68_33]